MDIQSKAAH